MQFNIMERICWVGDSITANGEFISNIWGYLLRKFADRRIEFYNCGISGDTVQNVIERFDRDVVPCKPQQAVVMLGMNDSGAADYSESGFMPAQELLQKYRDDMSRLLQMLEQTGAELILCTPTPYDDSAMLQAQCDVGRNKTLGCYAEIVREIAAEKGCPVVDFWAAMTQYNKTAQAVNPYFTVIGSDRIHPESLGHTIMSHIFLQTLGLLDNAERKPSNELLQAISEKREADATLRIIKEVNTMLQKGNHSDYGKFKEGFLAEIADKPYYGYWVDMLKLYEDNNGEYDNLQHKVAELIDKVNSVERIAAR